MYCDEIIHAHPHTSQESRCAASQAGGREGFLLGSAAPTCLKASSPLQTSAQTPNTALETHQNHRWGFRNCQSVKDCVLVSSVTYTLNPVMSAKYSHKFTVACFLWSERVLELHFNHLMHEKLNNSQKKVLFFKWNSLLNL